MTGSTTDGRIDRLVKAGWLEIGLSQSDLAEVLDAVSACFDRWRMPNSVLRRLCCII